MAIVDRSELYKGKPVKALTQGKSSSGGRNNLGRVTVRFRGGGHKRTYRLVDFKRRKVDMPAKVERIEYDPNRTSFIALIRYSDGELSYIVAPQRLAVGDEVVSGSQVDVKPGNAMPLANMPVGTIVHNIEMSSARAAPWRVRPDSMRKSSAVTGVIDRTSQFRRAASHSWSMFRDGGVRF